MTLALVIITAICLILTYLIHDLQNELSCMYEQNRQLIDRITYLEDYVNYQEQSWQR